MITQPLFLEASVTGAEVGLSFLFFRENVLETLDLKLESETQNAHIVKQFSMVI